MGANQCAVRPAWERWRGGGQEAGEGKELQYPVSSTQLDLTFLLFVSTKQIVPSAFILPVPQGPTYGKGTQPLPF